ncbi:glycosyltransferase [Vibrio diabolicus]|uniref:glycosyltransferase n=1 Tax=Vibrio diabolicus TaxID=50719 RepID=UPI00215EF8D8|nr:glycosyltransferase [Vibrio diabolicus]MCS0417676.1 glycosyltransferase [Vibrio diabolicus]
MKGKILVFYCNWGVAKDEHGYYIPSLHNSYIKQASKIYEKVILISKQTDKTKKTSEEIDSNVEVHMLPKMSSYQHSLLNFPKILKVIYNVSKAYPQAHYYIRCPEPFNWLFAIFLKNSTHLVYHFMSNPIEAINNNQSDSSIVKILKKVMYYPELLLSCLAGRRNKISCNGKGLKMELSKFVGKDSAVLHESTIQPSDIICSESIAHSESNERPIKLFYVGYLRAAKGLNYLIEAISDKKIKDRVTLTLAGDGEYYEELNRLIVKHELSGKVEFLGHIESVEVLTYHYKQSDIFVFPSLSEGSPRVVVEAMARGLPVIATDTGNTKYLLENDRGICVPTSNSREITNAILKLIDDENIRNKYVINGIKFAHLNTLESFFESFYSLADGK